ncbi:hypothetical protein ACHAWF_010595 [Thalassiosira exigua]
MSRLIQKWWTASDQSLLMASEHRLLSALVKHPFCKPEGFAQDVQAGINMVEFRANNPGDRTLPTVILAHGFGSGLSFFYRNIDHLLNSGKISRVICMDWLGMGGSARPPCWENPTIRSLFAKSQSSPSRFSLCESKFSTSQAVAFFLDPFDRVLRDASLFPPGEPLWLVGHSLGGYLAAKYTMRIHEQSTAGSDTFPNLTKLILASPVGFKPLPSPGERITSSDLPPALRLVDALWSANFTPQALVRLMGSSRGKNAVKRALHGRIPHLSTSSSGTGEKELDLLADYLYHITVAPASGEYAMNSLLEPGASEDGVGVYAREPLGGGYMAKLISQHPSSPLQRIKVLFGDRDWMQFHEAAARKEMDIIDSKSNIRSDVHTIPRAGHHVYIDNAPFFCRHILDD